MILDFKIKQDEFGYYVVMYRIIDGIELQYQTCKSMSTVLNFLEQDLIDFFHVELESDEKPKNNKMHFQDYKKASHCVDVMRDVVVKGLKTGNLYFAR